MCLMGIDIGTTGCKVCVFTREGRTVASAYKEYPLLHPQLNWSEENPDYVWARVVESIREAIATRKVQAEEVRALSLSVQGEAFMPVDTQRRWLYPCITTWDHRAEAQCRSFLRRFGKRRISTITGLRPMSTYPLFKILWLKEKKPDIYHKTWKFLFWEEYAIAKLSGTPAIDHSLASKTMLYDLKRGTWSGEILEAADIDLDLLSEPYPSGTPVGEITQEASEETGLARGTTIVAGGHDQACGALGVGAARKGLTYLATGTVEAIAVVLDKPILNGGSIESGYENYRHVVSGRYLLIGGNPSAGVVLRWFRDNFGSEEKRLAEKRGVDPYEVIIEEAAESPQGSKGLFLLPHFLGSGSPTWDSDSKGAIVGLTLAHSRKDVARAILEGLCFELRQIVEGMEKLGSKIGELRAVGGGAKSKLWVRMKADITGKTLIVPEITEASSLGAALLAGIAVKEYRTFDEAVGSVYREKERFLPREEAHDEYQICFNVYKRLYPSLKDLSSRIKLIT